MASVSLGGGRAFSRRAFLGGAVGVAGTALLASCAPAGGAAAPGGSDRIVLWDGPYGNADYVNLGKSLVAGYEPKAGLKPATYQSIPWANWLQTYTSAVSAGTTPAVSNGGTYQVVPFHKKGVIHPADNLLKSMTKSGMADDFAPGYLDFFNDNGTQLSIPWLADVRLLWYRKSILEATGVEVPTTWEQFLEVARTLKKNGHNSFGVSAGVGGDGYQTFISMLINNGGGLFNEAGEPDCLSDRNLEAVEFLLQLSQEGILDPANVSYTPDNLTSDVQSGKLAMTYRVAHLELSLSGQARDDVFVASPMAGPHGDKGTLVQPSNLMMYTTTPDIESSEAFLLWYLDAIKEYWAQNVITSIPVRKSFFELPSLSGDPNSVKAFDEWLPVAKLLSNRSASIPEQLNTIDGGQELIHWTQQICQGTESATKIQQTLQDGLERQMSRPA